MHSSIFRPWSQLKPLNLPLKQYMACTLLSSTANNSDALGNVRNVNSSPTHATLPLTPHPLVVPSIPLKVSHDSGYRTRCWVTPSVCAFLTPPFTTLIRKLFNGNDFFIHCSRNKLAVTNMRVIVVSRFPRPAQQYTMYPANSSSTSSADAVTSNQRLSSLSTLSTLHKLANLLGELLESIPQHVRARIPSQDLATHLLLLSSHHVLTPINIRSFVL